MISIFRPDNEASSAWRYRIRNSKNKKSLPGRLEIISGSRGSFLCNEPMISMPSIFIPYLYIHWFYTCIVPCKFLEISMYNLVGDRNLCLNESNIFIQSSSYFIWGLKKPESIVINIIDENTIENNALEYIGNFVHYWYNGFCIKPLSGYFICFTSLLILAKILIGCRCLNRITTSTLLKVSEICIKRPFRNHWTGEGFLK